MNRYKLHEPTQPRIPQGSEWQYNYTDGTYRSLDLRVLSYLNNENILFLDLVNFKTLTFNTKFVLANMMRIS